MIGIDSKIDAPPESSPVGALPAWLARFALPLGIFLATLLAFGFLHSYENWGDDWAQYVLQGKAILDRDLHDCVQQNAFMMGQSSVALGPVAYPWGLPLLLALAGKAFSFDIHVFKLCNVVIFLLLVLAVHRLARSYLNDTAALAVALMFAFNPSLLYYCNHVMTELPFTLVSVYAFLAMENRDLNGRSRALSPLVSGALAFAAFVFRTNGILILAAATVREFLPGPTEKGLHRPKLTELLLPYISFAVLYAIWSALFPSGGDGYFQKLHAASVHTLVTNALTYPVSLFDFFTAGYHSTILAVVLGPLVLWGASRDWRKTGHLSAYVLLTLALYIVWPERQDYRFMIPVTPFLVILMVQGLDAFAQWEVAGKYASLLARSVEYGFPILFLIAASGLVVTGKIRQQRWNPYDQPSSQMFQWIKSNTPGNAVISFFKPRAMHLLAGRLCLSGLPGDIPKVSYFVYTKHASNETGPPLQEYQQIARLTPAFENQDFAVYRVGARP
jgi:dolichyl-phosphate-mannose-protein mannosyltransferase